jgi:hypothetical protein
VILDVFFSSSPHENDLLDGIGGEMSKIRFLWTGEYRPPKKGEWFLDEYLRPVEATDDLNFPWWILLRQEGATEDE